MAWSPRAQGEHGGGAPVLDVVGKQLFLEEIPPTWDMEL